MTGPVDGTDDLTAEELADLRDDVRRLEHDLQESRAELRRLRESKWHQLGRTARDAKSPAGWKRIAKDAAKGARGGARTAKSRRTVDSGGALELIGQTLPVPTGPVRRPDVKVAAILDTFSVTAFRYEWDLVTDFGQDDWREVLTREKPQLLFVESAWNGNDGRWRLTMSTADAPRAPLRELVAWCKDQGIPTVFWNKEDPPNYERFIETAKLFDRVFTVDVDCIPRYVADLGHDRVEVLPFAAAPRIHNPIAAPDGRTLDVAFAGTYFAEKHPGRREQMEIVLAPARELGLTIFSRQDGSDKRYAFPKEYQPHVVGSLDYDDMLTAYKRFKVFLNVNSVVGSPSMCARRVFELSAAGTSIVSGPSTAIPEFYGDLVPIVHTPEETTRVLRTLVRQDAYRERAAQRAMRHTFASHTYGHRADEVLRAAGIAVPEGSTRPPTVSVLLCTKRPEQVAHAVAQVARQAHPHVQLVLVLHGDDFDVAEANRIVEQHKTAFDDTVVLPVPASTIFGDALNLGLDRCDGDYVAKMDDDDIYGEHYLTEQVQAFLYADTAIVGKATHFAWLRDLGATMLRFPGMEHRYTYSVKGPTLLVRGDVMRELRFSSLPRAIDSDLLRRAQERDLPSYATSKWDFAFVRHQDAEKHTYRITESDLLKTGRIAFFNTPEPHILTS